MNPTIFKQLDSRWSSKPYPTRNSSFGGNGCGCCSCVHVAIEQESKKNWTPENLRTWMINQGFAYAGQGTSWSGITETLKYLGHKNVVKVWDADPMSMAWAELNKGNRIGVLLFGSRRGPDGTLWTASGHYIAFTDYKVQNGQHWFYCKDSGGRNHDGWYCYEKSMRGTLPKLWIVERIGKAPTPPKPTPKPTPKKGTYTGAYPNPKSHLEKGDKGTEVTKLQKYLNWSFGGQAGYTKLAEDGIFGNDTHTWSVYWQNKAMGEGQGDGKVGAKTIAKMKEYGGYKPSPSPSKDIKVVDVSAYQDNINWTKAKADGIKGAIIKCGYRGAGTGKLNTDSMFLNHIKGAYKAGIPVGIYMFTTAINAKEGKEEADYAIKLWQTAGVPLSFPIAIDTENVFYKENGKTIAGRANDTKLSKVKRTEAVKAFCEQIKAKGYKPMIYANVSWLNNQLDMSKLPYDVWVAQYNSTCDYKGKYIIWQYSSEGRVDGIKGDVDMNKCYYTPKKYEPKPTPKPTPKKEYEGGYPTIAEIKSASNVGTGRRIAAWCKQICESGEYKYKVFTDDPKTQQCPICHHLTGKYKGFNCICYSWAGWRHGGGIPSKCNCEVINDNKGNQLIRASSDAEATKMVQKCAGITDLKVIRNKNGIPESDLNLGDIILYYDGNEYAHSLIYVGDGKVSDSGRGHTPQVMFGGPYLKKKCKVAIQYTGGNSYLQRLDKGKGVRKLKDYLEWYDPKTKLADDDSFGNGTKNAVIAFQEKEMGKGQGDGFVGPKTIEAMKAVRK